MTPTNFVIIKKNWRYNIFSQVKIERKARSEVRASM